MSATDPGQVPEVVAVSETAIMVSYPQIISREGFLTVSAHTARLKTQLGESLVDMVPAYASILLTFNPRQANGEWLVKEIRRLLSEGAVSSTSVSGGQQINIPVYYGEEVAPDLALLANFAGLSPEEVVALHSGQCYDVYAIGFAPGFAYLGIVDERIAMARKSTPRSFLPAGSVGIAGEQTAVYPADSPGGWQIIGRTPVPMVDFDQTPFARIHSGDTVRFKPISRDVFIELGGRLE